MLQEMLCIIAQGGVHTKRELAQRLDVSEELLQQMIDELVRLGYLKPVVGDCKDRCAGCAFTAECAIGGAGRIWTLIGKGREVINKNYTASKGGRKGTNSRT